MLIANMKKYGRLNMLYIIHIIFAIIFLLSFIFGFFIDYNKILLIDMTISLISFIVTIYTGTKITEKRNS